MSKYEDVEGQHGFQQEIRLLDPRIGFIRKVYGILCCQLLATVFLCLLAMYSTSYFNFMMSSAGLALMIISAILTIILVIMLFCCLNFSRSVPTNYILLSIFTICEAYLVSFSCARTDPKLVFMAAIMTFGIVVALTLYAMTTKRDFTFMGGTLFVFGMVFLLVGIFLLFTNNPVLHVIYAGIGVFLFGIYLIYDTQLVIGNKKHELSVDDYIIGALILYIDIIMIFVYVLEFLQNMQRV